MLGEVENPENPDFSKLAGPRVKNPHLRASGGEFETPEIFRKIEADLEQSRASRASAGNGVTGRRTNPGNRAHAFRIKSVETTPSN